MNSRIFNTEFENCMRLLLALERAKQPVTADELVNADFMATYAKHFGFGKEDLHGSSAFVDSIYTQRRAKGHEAIIRLVANGYATVDGKGDEPRFIISDFGTHLSSKFRSPYSKKYRRLVALALTKLRNNEQDIIKLMEEA